jgi:serine/threonine-protein kinase
MATIDWAAFRQEALGKFTLSALPPTMQLPALPHAVTMFVQKSEDANTSDKDLARIIETDTGLMFELLKYVNSSAVGLRQRVANVHQAIQLLGRRQCKTLIMTTGMQAAVRARKSRLINQRSFWNASLQRALFAKEVALLLKADGDTAFAGAMLQDYLLPVLTNDLFDSYLKFVEARDEQPPCLAEYERTMFGWDHSLAASALAHRWHLPDELVCCILYHHSGLGILKHAQLGPTSVAAVALSALLSDQIRQQEGGIAKLRLLEEKWTAFNLQKVAESVDAKQAAMNLGVQNDFPLMRAIQAAAGKATAC